MSELIDIDELIDELNKLKTRIHRYNKMILNSFDNYYGFKESDLDMEFFRAIKLNDISSVSVGLTKIKDIRGVSIQAAKRLQKNGYNCINDLKHVHVRTLLKIPLVGVKSLESIKEYVSEMNGNKYV